MSLSTSGARRLFASLCALVAVGSSSNCANPPRSEQSSPKFESVPAGARVLPTLYIADRFFAVPITERGDSVTLFLDTGDNSRVWQTFAARVGLHPESTRLNNAGVLVARLPDFRVDRAVPNPSLNNGRVIVTPPQDHFDTLMSTHADGQLGSDWFANRVWTFDYPGHRLLLQSDTALEAPAGAHQAQLGFPTDSTGRRVGHTPHIVIVVDGDSINTLFDTGATMWLPNAALRAVNDGGPSERASSIIWGWMFARWRQRHPDWPVVENADIATGAPMIRVPSVSIAGFEVGPVWFRSLTQAPNPPPAPPAGVPVVRTRVNGTIGGNVLRNFVVTVDYPRSLAYFTRK